MKDDDDLDADFGESLYDAGDTPVDYEADKKAREKAKREAPVEGRPNDDADEMSLSLKDGRQIGVEERAKRDMQIFRLLKRGISPESVALQMQQQGHRIGPRQVKRVQSKMREALPTLVEMDATDILRDTLDGYDAGIEELALIGARSNISASTRVSAIRSRLEALRGRVELLQSIGVVPHDLGQLRVIADVAESARRTLDVMEKNGIPEEVQIAIIEAIEGRPLALPEAVVTDAEVVG